MPPISSPSSISAPRRWDSTENKALLIPITQQHVADTLGLSIVHTNKTLRKLAERKLIRWHDRACEVLDVAGLMEIAGWEGCRNGGAR